MARASIVPVTLVALGALLTAHVAGQSGFCTSVQVTNPGSVFTTKGSAMSADGQTLAIAAEDVTPFAVYTFARKAGAWVPTGKVTAQVKCGANLCPAGPGGDGSSSLATVALSGDGAIMAAGSPFYQFVIVYARNSSGAYNFRDHIVAPEGCSTRFGWSLSLSGSGKVLAIGAPGGGGGCATSASAAPITTVGTGSGGGSTYVYTRARRAWGPPVRLMGSNYTVLVTPSVAQGTSVAVSKSGTTVVVGGPGDRWSIGAAWVFSLAGGKWAQVGGKLVGAAPNDAFETMHLRERGLSVAIDATGATVAMGGRNSFGEAGTAWVFKRAGGVYTQLGVPVMVRNSGVRGENHRSVVALSGDGALLAVGDGDIRTYVRQAGGYAPLAPVVANSGEISLSSDGLTLSVHGRADAQVYARCQV